MSTTQTSIMATAETVAAHLHDLPNAMGVYLFGSLARRGEGHDIDMIVVVPEEIFAAYIESLQLADGDIYFQGGGTRLVKACCHIHFDERLFQLLDGTKIDLLLFPPDWQHRCHELQMAFNHRDPNFMANVAMDARGFDQRTGQFN